MHLTCFIWSYDDGWMQFSKLAKGVKPKTGCIMVLTRIVKGVELSKV